MKRTLSSLVGLIVTLMLLIPGQITFSLSNSSLEEPIKITNSSSLGSITSSQLSQDQNDYLLYESTSGLGLKLLGQIGGRIKAISTQGNYVYFAAGPRVLVFDIQNPENPQEVGQTNVMPGIVENLTVVDNFLYTANGEAGIYIFDITDPTNPANRGSFDTFYFAHDIDVQDNYAYVADGYGGTLHRGGFRIIDITNRNNPREVAVLNPLSLRPTRVVVEGNYAYLA